MRAVLCHRHLPLPTPPPATELLPSAFTSTAAAVNYRTTPSVSSSSAAAPTAIDRLPADSTAAAFWDYQFLFASQRSESAKPVPLRLVAGSVPADFPVGTYYLAGPGVFTDDHGSTVHPLDGHGYLRAFSFAGDGGTVLYSARFVETQAKREEREEGTGRWRFTHRGPFSVLRGGKRVGNVKVMKNVANTSVLRWGGRLMCLWEGGDPYEIDPRSLDTVGPVDLVGQERHDGDRPANDRRWELAGAWDVAGLGVDVAAHFLKPVLRGVFNMPPKRMLAHYKIDPKRNRLLLLSCNAEDMLLPRSNFTFYEFDCNFELKQKKEFVISDHMMIHDWAFTDSHYVLLGNRIKLDVPGSLLALSGLYPMITALSVNPSRQSTPVYLLPRFSGSAQSGRDWRVPIEAPLQLWSSHIGNAFEERDEVGNSNIQLQVSVCSYQWFNFQKMFGYNWRTGKLDPSFMNMVEGKEASLPHLVQVTVELDSTGACRRCTVGNASKQWNKPADFPAINPALSGQRNTYIYAGTASGSRRFLPHFPFDSVVKLNCSDGSATSWSTGRREFIGEPIFVPRGTKEDDGYILVVEYAVARQRCYLVVLDAKRIGEANALVAKLEVPKHLTFPLGFHGFWAAR
ncbi:carotenoid cleavage dioxygenase 7, chloroplastic [Cocos nucifera]|nr:carotenoid cleavage dioxygenase 7, chloroplastic [Cocos nucifera]